MFCLTRFVCLQSPNKEDGVYNFDKDLFITHIFSRKERPVKIKLTI